jgi:hypothetical protein
MSKYVVVWLDYGRALFFHVHPERFDESTIWVAAHEILRQSKEIRGLTALEQQQLFFADVARALVKAEEVLLVGPLGAAKLELFQYALAHDAPLAGRVIGLETVELPNGDQLVHYARSYFLPGNSLR